MGNIHGRRLNVDVPKAKGSGYSVGHSPDFLVANDEWAKFINLKYGPDGNVFVIDCYDRQACHHNDPNIWDRTNGRIYNVSHRWTKPVANVALAHCSDAEPVGYQRTTTSGTSATPVGSSTREPQNRSGGRRL